MFATRDRVGFISIIASNGKMNTQHKTEHFVM